MEQEQMFYFNGIDAQTGEYLLPPMPLEKLASFIKEQAVDESRTQESEPFGLPITDPPIHSIDVSSAGWAVVLHRDEDPAVRQTMKRLYEYRLQQSSDKESIQIWEYANEDSWADWLIKQHIKRVPYYLLLVGAPDRIPIFSQLLSSNYALGLLHFDHPTDYEIYVDSVINYENGKAEPRHKEAIFFCTKESDDQATTFSAKNLVEPLANSITNGEPAQLASDNRAFAIGRIWGKEATYRAMANIFAPPDTAPLPAFVFSATHGLGYRQPSVEQLDLQGALRCQDTAPFSAESLASLQNARVHGLIAFFFASFSVGTPYSKPYLRALDGVPQVFAKESFIAALPKKLLSHPLGSALACIGQMGRAWGFSYAITGSRTHLQPYHAAVREILGGQSVGYALNDMRVRYKDLTARLGKMLQDLKHDKQVSIQDLVTTWVERNDAGSYIILGDPAVRLRIEMLMNVPRSITAETPANRKGTAEATNSLEDQRSARITEVTAAAAADEKGATIHNQIPLVGSEAPTSEPPEQTGVTNVQVGSVNFNQNVFSMERYEPPASDNVMSIYINKENVLLYFDAKDGSPTNYTCPNKLAQKAYHQKIFNASDDPRRYGNLLFNAIIHDDQSRFGQDEVTTKKGWMHALEKSNKKLRIELILDYNSRNLKMHEYCWEYLCQAGDVPMALLPRSPFYRRLAQTGGPLLVDGKQQKLKVLVAICNPSDQARASFPRIAELPPIEVSPQKKIAELALDRLQRAGLLEYRILPENPEQTVTRQMLLDTIKDGYHVLHLVCHGLFVGDNPPGNYCLAIDKAQDQLPFIDAEDANTWMNASPIGLRLVVLAACLSAVSLSGDVLRGLGPQLVLKGQVPAVIAMQQYLPLSTAQLFMQSFYDDLARSGRVDMALAATRQSIFDQEGGDSGTWAIPVLFMSARDGQLIKIDEERARSLRPLVPDIRTYRQLGGREDPQLTTLNQVLANEAQAIGAQHLVSAFQRTARTALADSPSPLAIHQDRDRLTKSLNLRARVDAVGLADFVGKTTSRVRVEGSVTRSVDGLDLPIDTYRQIAAVLNTGKHIILIGAPGTGKTTLAQAICHYAQENQLCTGAIVATATADWTTFDTVGGYVPTTAQTLEFRAGSFLQAIAKGEWLVIDEINRAEIDKAFGELFTVLSGHRVDTPHMVGPHRVRVLPPARFDENDQDPERWIPKPDITLGGYEYVVHPQWRIIGTMNVYDRSALYSLSLAFMRRFAFIDLNLPANYIDLCREWIRDDRRIIEELDRITLEDKLELLLGRETVLMQRRTLGPAVVRDMIGHVGERYASRTDIVALLAEAFLLYAAPQLDGLDPTAIQNIYTQLQTIFGAAAENKHILKRIADLYPFVSFA